MARLVLFFCTSWYANSEFRVTQVVAITEGIPQQDMVRVKQVLATSTAVRAPQKGSPV